MWTQKYRNRKIICKICCLFPRPMLLPPPKSASRKIEPRSYPIPLLGAQRSWEGSGEGLPSTGKSINLEKSPSVSYVKVKQRYHFDRQRCSAAEAMRTPRKCGSPNLLQQRSTARTARCTHGSNEA